MSEETEIQDENADAADATQTNPEAQADAPEDSEQARIVQLESELAAAKDQLLRAMAETENVRRRSERQVSDASAFAIEKFAKDLLNVSDNMTRALASLDDTARAGLGEHGQGLLSGVEMTRQTLHDALSKHGVSPITADPGATFDPNQHEAVSRLPSDQPGGTVAQVFQSGWKIKDRVLRAAIVAVSLGPAQAATETQTPEDETS